MKLWKRVLTVCILFLSVFQMTAFAAATINSDGFGYSGALSGGTPLPNDITITGYGNSEFDTSVNFHGTIFVGNHIWTIGRSGGVVKLDPATGATTNYYYNAPSNTNMGNINSNSVPLNGGVSGGIFDGTYIWLTPMWADSIIRINPADGTMTGFPLSAGINMGTAQGSNAYKFYHSAFDGTNIWLAPMDSDRVVKFNTITHELIGYNITGINTGDTPTAQSKFHGAIYDGSSVWLTPFMSNRVVKVDASGAMTFYELTDGINSNTNMGNASTTNYKFQSAISDGTSIWLIPDNSDRIVQLNPATGTMTGYDLNGANMGTVPTSSRKYAGAAFDGENIWMAPIAADRIAKFNISSKTFTGIDIVGTNIGDYNTGGIIRGHGAVFDGTNVWMAPFESNRLLKISPAKYPYTIEYYQDTFRGTPIGAKNGVTMFATGHQLTSAEVDADFPSGWVDLFRPAGYNSGAVQGYPFILGGNNILKVLYSAAAASTPTATFDDTATKVTDIGYDDDHVVDGARTTQEVAIPQPVVIYETAIEQQQVTESSTEVATNDTVDTTTETDNTDVPGVANTGAPATAAIALIALLVGTAIVIGARRKRSSGK